MSKHPTLRRIVPMTASWSSALPDRYVRIGISRGPPRGQRGFRMYKPLAPGFWFRSVEPEEFRRRYLAQLERLDPNQVLSDLAELAGDKTPALLCFERPPPDPAWCHRGLVASWLFDKIGLEVREIGHEHRGGGWSHPKLPLDWRGSR